jgi:CBS domain-containing protein
MPTAGEFCNRRVAIAYRGEPIVDAARRMRDENVGSLVVVDEAAGRRIPIGILTDRDLVVGVLARTDRRHIDAVTVGDVMTSDVVKAWEDDDLADTWKRMRSYGVRRIPVVDADGTLAGIVAFDDLVEWLQEQVNDLTQLLSRERRQEQERRA